MKNDEFKFLKSKILSGKIYPEFFPIKPHENVINIGCGEGPQAIVYSGYYNKMIGADINKNRLKKSKEAMKLYECKNYKIICTNVEQMPLSDKNFDKAIAVDIFEHVKNPKKLCTEANRLLKENGKLLITFPAMYDKFIKFLHNVRYLVLKGRKQIHSTEWDPDAHNQEYPLSEWIVIVESCGFKLIRSRASTLFPPLHLLGIPKFWFSNDMIHKIDNYFCKMPFIKNYGQALVCIFVKC